MGSRVGVVGSAIFSVAMGVSSGCAGAAALGAVWLLLVGLGPDAESPDLLRAAALVDLMESVGFPKSKIGMLKSISNFIVRSWSDTLVLGLTE